MCGEKLSVYSWLGVCAGPSPPHSIGWSLFTQPPFPFSRLLVFLPPQLSTWPCSSLIPANTVLWIPLPPASVLSCAHQVLLPLSYWAHICLLSRPCLLHSFNSLPPTSIPTHFTDPTLMKATNDSLHSPLAGPLCSNGPCWTPTPRVVLLVVFLPYLLVFSKVLSFSLYPVFSLDNLVHFNN